MAKTPVAKYHCDGYYFDNVCPSRGSEDPADIRHDNEGWVRQCRCFCKTNGLNIMDNYEICPHCVEHKHLFRAEPRVLTGRVVSLTPFQVKEEATAHTVKAFMSPSSVRRFLKKADSKELYGVEVTTGKLITIRG